MSKIPWSRIREAFDGEWIEIVDCAWRENSIHPSAGRVRHHCSNRSELLSKIALSERVEGSVVLFVGPSLPTIQTHNTSDWALRNSA